MRSHFLQNMFTFAGRNSSVRIATRHRVDGLGGRIPVEAIFSAPIQTGPRAHTASYTMGTGPFPGLKRPGRGVDNPPHLATMLKKLETYTSTPAVGLRGLF
jgi:hypothetical protein